MASENKALTNNEIADEIELITAAVGDFPHGIKFLQEAAERLRRHTKEVAELRECLKEAVEWSCGNHDDACEDCVAHGGDTPCKCERWRKALEGGAK